MITTNIPSLEEINQSKKEIVTVVNRFWREVEVSRYQYLKMVKNGECNALEIEKEDTSKTKDLENELILITETLEKEVWEKQVLIEKVETLEKEVWEKQVLIEKLQVELDKLKSKPETKTK